MEVEIDQQIDPAQPEKWFTLKLRCPACAASGELYHLTGTESQWWINLFRMRHEERNCGHNPHYYK